MSCNACARPPQHCAVGRWGWARKPIFWGNFPNEALSKVFIHLSVAAKPCDLGSWSLNQAWVFYKSHILEQTSPKIGVHGSGPRKEVPQQLYDDGFCVEYMGGLSGDEGTPLNNPRPKVLGTLEVWIHTCIACATQSFQEVVMRYKS